MGVFRMPSLGADMEAGTLAEWLVSPGDTVARGDVIAVVETQKGAIEIEVFENGTVHELTAERGAVLPVGTPLAVILAEGEEPPQTVAPTAARPPVESAPAERKPVPDRPVPSAEPHGQHKASPAARVRARELGVDLAKVTGSGPDGKIIRTDVDHVLTGAKQRPSEPRSPLAEMRKAIAAAMTRAKQTIPHFYLSHTMDVQPAIDFLARLNADRPPAERVLLGALFVRAASLAASKVKTVNGHFIDGVFEPADVVNPGVAVALRGGGLVAPALMDATELDLDRTMTAMRDLVSRARAGRLKGSEMTKGTITISSLGETGAEAMTGVIFPPQVAIVGIGAPQTRPWVINGQVVPRTVVTITLSADHRVSDGRQAARFVSEFETLIQHPESL